MDALEIQRPRIVGNSLGGRIAIEIGLIAPERTAALGLLCPAVAWIRRSLHPLVRLIRPEVGMLPHAFRRSLVASHVRRMFHERDQIDPDVADLVVDEFRRIYHSPAAGTRSGQAPATSIWKRRSGATGSIRGWRELRPPALFVWGANDSLVPPAFGRHVREWLPEAEQVTLEHCGHVPQVEQSERTNELLTEFFDRAGRAQVRAA